MSEERKLIRICNTKKERKLVAKEGTKEERKGAFDFFSYFDLNERAKRSEKRMMKK